MFSYGGCGKGKLSWRMMSQGVFMSQTMGLHRKPPTEELSSNEEKAKAQRVRDITAWGCFQRLLSVLNSTIP
jgi:hypothetical protein